MFRPALSAATRRTRQSLFSGVFGVSVVCAGSLAWSAHQRRLHNDAVSNVPTESHKLPPTKKPKNPNDDFLSTFASGANKRQTLLPTERTDSFKGPSELNWLEGVALRDLALHETHAACVDCRGDVYQWGEGYFNGDTSENQHPRLTLRGKDITSLRLSGSQVFALSRSGRLYTLPSSQSTHSDYPLHNSNSSCLGLGWLFGNGAPSRYRELLPKQKLGWTEKFTSISSGSDHLLALTSHGRAFAHPVNKNANASGQLGVQKIEVQRSGSHETTQVELIPKSKSAPEDQQPGFCGKLLEIPSLKGLNVKNLVAGGRSSFALLSSGRVLGWGANEFGQLGLGNQIPVEVVSIPTEIVLWRSTSRATETECKDISAGGDLTCFTVSRKDNKTGAELFDVLMCGNGQYGGLGANFYSNAQSTPVRTRNASGLTGYDDATKALRPIAPHSVSISPTGHVLLSLDTPLGRDCLGWGKNHDYELGTGRRGVVGAPMVLQDADGERMMLRTKKVKEVRDLQGKVWKKGITVHQELVAGHGNSVVYWKI